MSDRIDTTPSSGGDELDLFRLVGILMKHRKMILLSTSLVMFAAIAMSLVSLVLPADRNFLPNIYRPEATILIGQNDSGGISGALAASGMSSIAAIAGLSVGGSSNGELAVLLAESNGILDQLATEFGVAAKHGITIGVKAESRKLLLHHLSAAFDDKTSTVKIAYKDIDAVFAQRIVNRIVELLDSKFANLGSKKAQAQKVMLESKLVDVQAQIKRLENEAKAFSTKNRVLDVEALATEQVTVLAKLRSELIIKDIEITNYENFSTIEDPVIRRLKSERVSLQQKLNEIEQGSSVLPSQKEIPKIAFEYADIQRDLAVQMEIFKILTQQYELAKLNVEGQDPTFQVLELAEVPDMKWGPSRGLICISATIVAFLLAILAAFTIEAIKKIRSDPEAIRKLKGL